MPAPTNIRGSFRSVSDFTTWLDGDSLFIGDAIYQDVAQFRADAAITAGDAVQFVAPTASLPLSVKALTTTPAESLRFVGVALETVAAGDNVNVCVQGVCSVNIGSATVAFGDVATGPANTTAGVVTVLAQPTAAGTLVGNVFGTFLSANDISGTDKAVLWVAKQ